MVSFVNKPMSPWVVYVPVTGFERCLVNSTSLKMHIENMKMSKTM
jgi:hypothetical protein